MFFRSIATVVVGVVIATSAPTQAKAGGFDIGQLLGALGNNKSELGQIMQLAKPLIRKFRERHAKREWRKRQRALAAQRYRHRRYGRQHRRFHAQPHYRGRFMQRHAQPHRYEYAEPRSRRFRSRHLQPMWREQPAEEDCRPGRDEYRQPVTVCMYYYQQKPEHWRIIPSNHFIDEDGSKCMKGHRNGQQTELCVSWARR